MGIYYYYYYAMYEKKKDHANCERMYVCRYVSMVPLWVAEFCCG